MKINTMTISSNLGDLDTLSTLNTLSTLITLSHLPPSFKNPSALIQIICYLELTSQLDF